MVIAWDCKRWRTLPEAGGLFDQPLALTKAMTATLAVYEAAKLRAQMKGKVNSVDFAERYPDEADICLEVDRLRGLL